MRSTDPHHDPADLFEILVREHADMLETYLRSLVHPGTDLDDLFQETMLVAWRRLDDFDRNRSFGAWLRGIARVLVLERTRTHAFRPSTTNPLVLDAIESRFASLLQTPGDTFTERAERLLDCIANLPDRMREAIHLVYGRGLSIVAAAGSVGDSKESFKKRVQRSRRLLAECLESKGGAA